MLLSLLASALVLLSLNHPDGIYASGDTVKIYATKGAETTLVHEQVYTGPTTIRFDYEDTCIGFVVDPEEYVQALPCPRDFDRYWKKQIRQMRAIPANTQLREVEGREGYKCYELTIDCVDGVPVRGYVAMPVDAGKKSLPIVMFAHAAGVAGSWCRAYPGETMDMAAWGNGAICVNINAFGMLNDQPQSYYDELEKGELKNYSIRVCDVREDYFFKNMYLRLVRALDFACSLPEWDQKRVLAYGQSQGGAQAIALAGLDKRVTSVVGIVPAGCNSAGSLFPGGHDSWPMTYQFFATPELGQSILPYYDGCNFLARTKADLYIEYGLMDVTCNPQAIHSALNANKRSSKTVIPSPWRYHDEPDARYWQAWRDNIYTPRWDWVNAHLK